MTLEKTIRRLRQDYSADKAAADAEANESYESDRRPDATRHDHLVVAYEKYDIPYHTQRPVLVVDVQDTVTAATLADSAVGEALHVGTPQSLLTPGLLPGGLDVLLSQPRAVTVGVTTQVVGPYVTEVVGTGYLVIDGITYFKLRDQYTCRVHGTKDMANRLQRGLAASHGIRGVPWAGA